MSGVIADMVSSYPEAELVAFAADNNYQFICLIPGFAKIHKIPIGNPFKSIRQLRKTGKFDLVIDFGSWPRVSALYIHFL